MNGKREQNPRGFGRSSGILLHITSLPSPFGIGDLGGGASAFLAFLKEAGQSIWQFLPVGPTSPGLGHSPYTSPSAFAGNPLFISPELLFQHGFLAREELDGVPKFSEYLVEFKKVVPFKEGLFSKAYQRWKKRGAFSGFEAFCQLSHWLDDYALYQALKEHFGYKPWYDWPRSLARREDAALKNASSMLEDKISYHKFIQYMFHLQWLAFKKDAHERSIRLFGDIPIYVALDSADVWANQSIFELDPDSLRPVCVAGVPPDYFSATGQRWGNPLYKWEIGGRPNEQLYAWWKARFERLKELVDIVRIDHFRGFAAYWSIPFKEKTAVKGKWIKGPGRQFFELTKDGWKGLDIVAEDLGTITPDVIELREELGFPGMKVLQFAFDSDEHNLYLPHNYRSTNFVVYTGTHDNDTTLGWYMDPGVSERSKARARRYANSDGSRIHWDFLRMAMSTVADTAIIPMQDVLGFGSDCRMNRPSSSKGNWRWRLAQRFITSDLAHRLRDETQFYARLSAKDKRQ